MNKTVLLSLLAVVIIGGLFFWQVNSDGPDSVETNTAESVPEMGDQGSTDQTSTPVDEAPVLEAAKLEAVGSYSGEGTATRSTEGAFIHEVTAMLDDPAPGDFYEGWLVGPSVVSTGRLVEEAEGEWSLVFESDEDLSNHNRVVITEETEANGLDGIPEDHVLEGSF